MAVAMTETKSAEGQSRRAWRLCHHRCTSVLNAVWEDAAHGASGEGFEPPSLASKASGSAVELSGDTTDATPTQAASVCLGITL